MVHALQSDALCLGGKKKHWVKSNSKATGIHRWHTYHRPPNNDWVINSTSLLSAPDVWQERPFPAQMSVLLRLFPFSLYTCVHMHCTKKTDTEVTPLQWHEKLPHQRAPTCPISALPVSYLFPVFHVSWFLMMRAMRLPNSPSEKRLEGGRGGGKVVVWTWNPRFIHRPACCQSSTSRWQRLEGRTWGSCSPEWRCLRPLCRTAWRCSQLESGETVKQPVC